MLGNNIYFEEKNCHQSKQTTRMWEEAFYDNCCNMSIFTNLEWFSSFYNNSKIVNGVNGISTPKYRGEISIVLDDGTEIRFSDALYMPGLEKSIVSESDLMNIFGKNELVFVCDKETGSWYTRKDNKPILPIVNRINGLFTLKFRPAKITNKIFSIHTQVGLDMNDILHHRFGHPSKIKLQQLLEGNRSIVRSNIKKFKVVDCRCEACDGAKFRHTKVGSVGRPIKVNSHGPGEFIHTDISGKFSHGFNFDGKNYFYFLVVRDDFSRWIIVRLLRKKSDALAEVIFIISLLEAQDKSRLRKIRLDNGEVATCNAFENYCLARGIIMDSIVPNHPHMNGVAESAVGQIKRIGLSIHLKGNLSGNLWGYLVMHAVDLLNVWPHTAIGSCTPYERRFGFVPEIDNYMSFGCKVNVPMYKEYPKGTWNSKVATKYYVGYHSFSIFKAIDQLGRMSYHRFQDAKFYENVFFTGGGGNATEYYNMEEDVVIPTFQKELEICTKAAIRTLLQGSASTTDPMLGDSVENHVVDRGEMTEISPQIRKELANHNGGNDRQQDLGKEEMMVDEIVPSDNKNLSVETSTNRNYQNRRITRAMAKAQSNMSLDENMNDIVVEIDQDDNDATSSFENEEESVGTRTYKMQVDSPFPIFENTMLQISNLNDERTKVMLSAVGIQWDGIIPTSTKMIEQTNHAKEWYAAFWEEIQNLDQHGTKEEIDASEIPPDIKPIKTKEVYAMKKMKSGEPERFKVRIVVRGDYQVYGVDYFETYSPVIKMTTLRLLFCIATWFNIDIWLYDVVGAFNNGNLEEVVWVWPPPTYEMFRPGKVWRLLKALYGLKQAGLMWYKRLSDWLKKIGFEECSGDPCLYYRGIVGASCWVAFFVDDVIVVANKQIRDEFYRLFSVEFAIVDKGELSYHLGIEFDYSPDRSCLLMHHYQYINKILKRFQMEECKKAVIPMNPGADYGPKTEYEVCLDKRKLDYNSLIGSVMYPSTTCRLDICTAVSLWARNLHNPTRRHWNGAMHILRYLKHTQDLGLLFVRKSVNIPFELNIYSDAAEPDKQNSKCQTGISVFLGNSCISYRSVKQTQTSIEMSIGEQYALFDATLDGLAIVKVIKELEVEISTPTAFTDNNLLLQRIGTGQITRKNAWLDRRYNLMREKFLQREMHYRRVDSNDNPADMNTKPKSLVPFIKLRRLHNMIFKRELQQGVVEFDVDAHDGIKQRRK